MDNHHVLNDPLVGGMNNTQGYRQMGQQPQQPPQHHQNQQYNDFAVDPSLIGDSWQQQPGQSYGHAGHQDVFAPPPQHQQAYNQYGHTPQPHHFSYGQPHHQQTLQQQSYPTQYASIYGQTSHSPAPQNAGVYDNQFVGMPNNAHSTLNGDQVQSRGFQSFDRSTAAFPYQSSSRGPTPTQQTIAPHHLNNQYQTQPMSNVPQQQLNGDSNNLFNQNWGSQPVQNHASVVAPERSQQVLAANPEPTNQKAPPSRVSTAPTTSSAQPQPQSQQPQSSLKPPSPTPIPTQQTLAARTKKDDIGLRLTHADLLESTTPTRRFKNARYIFIDSRTVELPDKLAHKALPSWQVKSNRSGIPLVEGLHERLSSTGRIHKSSSSRKQLKATGQSRAERVRTNSATGSATNSPRPSIESETESSEYNSSEDDSDYSSDDDEMLDLRTLEEVRPEPRPTDIAKAAAWDAFSIIYSPAGRRPLADERTTVAQKYPGLIQQLREQLIKVNTDLDAAKASKAASVKELKVKQKAQEQALVKALRVAIDSPHQEMRDTLFSFEKFSALMANILRLPLKSGDYFGDLSLAVFELMATYKFDDAAKQTLEKAKFPQISKKFMSRAEIKAADEDTQKRQEDIKKFITAVEKGQQVMPKRVDVSSRIGKSATKPDDKAALKSANISSRAPTTPAPPKYEGTSGLKRAREPEDSTNAPNKRSAGENTKPTTKSGDTIASAPHRPATSTSFFKNLGKAAPKPATPAPALAKPVVKKPAPPQAPRPSVLGSLLDSINAPKPEPKKVEAAKRAPETPEEKKKRERKESRRHLRVKFKEAGELEQIKFFTHEKAEDEGRDMDMLRDAHDDRSEGMMLKKRLEAADVDDEDTEMPDAVDTDINNEPYSELSEIDFSNLPEEVRDRNMTSRGGRVEIRTPQQEIQENREQTELMVVYTDASDIPDSAKEPPSVSAENKNPARFGDVTNQTIRDRLREIQFSGDEVAFNNMKAKLREEIKRREQLKDVTSIPENIAKLLQIIKENPSKVSTLPVPTGMEPAAMANLYLTFSSYQGLPFPVVEAPAWMAISSGLQQSWREGMAMEAAHKAKLEAEKERARAEEEAKKAFEARAQMSFQPQPTAPPMGQPPFMGAPPMGAPPMGFPGLAGPPPDPAQMAALFAQMGLPPPGQAAGLPLVPQWGAPPPTNFAPPANPFPPPPQVDQYGRTIEGRDSGSLIPYPGYNNDHQQSSQHQQHGNDAYGNNRRQNTYMDESSDGMRGGNSGNNNHGVGGGKKKNKKKWNKNKNKTPNWDNVGRGAGGMDGALDYDDGVDTGQNQGGGYKTKTQPCSFFKQGNCTKGDSCSYIHDMNY